MSRTIKCIILLLVSSTILLQHSCGSNASSQTEMATEKFQLNFTQDSGYIRASDAFDFLLSNALIDTTGGTDNEDYVRYAYSLDQSVSNSATKYYKYWDYKPTDTIGKYYAVAATGNYLTAISLGNDVLLFELNPCSDLINYGTHGYNIYGHGNYPCCWDSIDDMLKKYENYFAITTCGTGTAYCSEYIIFFKDDTVPLADPIPISIFSGAWGNEIPGQILTSAIQLKADSLIMRYKVEEFIETEDGETKTIAIDFFTVSYVLCNGKFETNEEYKFNGILL